MTPAVKLGFSVEELLPKARGGGALKMGLTALSERDWLQHAPDLDRRAAAFDACPQSLQVTPEAEAPGYELAKLRGVSGGLEAAARSMWEDVCLLTRAREDEPYRLVGAAVAFPTDWCPADKLGLSLVALHKPIHGYADQLASGVDHFMGKLKPGAIYGRCNWFVSPTDALRWVAEPASQGFAHVTAANAADTLFIRSERQTLRKLPGTGAIVFTIGVYVAPLRSLSASNVALLAEAVATIPLEEAERRGARFYAPALRAFAGPHDAGIAA